MPRSIRRTLARSQASAISVALLDHGEIVPWRGTTYNFGDPFDSLPGASPDSNRASSRWRCSADSGAARSMK